MVFHLHTEDTQFFPIICIGTFQNSVGCAKIHFFYPYLLICSSSSVPLHPFLFIGFNSSFHLLLFLFFQSSSHAPLYPFLFSPFIHSFLALFIYSSSSIPIHPFLSSTTLHIFLFLHVLCLINCSKWQMS